VNSLWTSPRPPDGAMEPAPVAPAAGAARQGEPPSELGLFQQQMPDARTLFRGRV
jgi:hypothetical protein